MEGEAPKRVKGGRPRRHAPNARRPTMAFRMSDALHQQLIAASVANQRSLSEEIERRLEVSFAAQTPSLTAEDVRQIVREEMGQQTSGSAKAYGYFGGRLVELGTKLMDAPAGHVGPPVPPRFVPAAVAASKGLPAVDLRRRAPMIGDGCRDGNCVARGGYCGHQGCPWPNKRERAAMGL